MPLEKNEKVLFVVGMEQQLNYDYIMKNYHIVPEEIVVVESDEVDSIQPFGDLMRDILKLVYVKNIEEIFIIDHKAERKHDQTILEKLEKSLHLQKNLPVIDYLFNHCKPEFPNRSLKEWLLGNEEGIEAKQKIGEIIRSHPLMPNSIKVNQADGSSVL